MLQKLRKTALIALLIALSLAFAACVSDASPAQAEEDAEAVSAVSAVSAASEAGEAQAAGTGWSIGLKGIREDALWESVFEDSKKHASHYREVTVESKGVKLSYQGMPLWLAVAMIDGPDAKHAYRFDKELWEAGYDLTLIAKDGYSATFNTKDVAPDALLIADSENGKAIAPMTVGNAPKNLWVRDLVRIDTTLAPSALEKAAASFRLELDINGAAASFSLKELESLAIYKEARGAYTTSAGTRYEGVYGGVKLLDLLKSYADLAANDSITFVAMDGYEMSYPGKQLMDNKDGDWLLAFKLDGEYLEKDPGYVRTIKVGPGTPNIEGHLSVRMVKKIVVKQKDFVDFSLSVKGKASLDLDRGTIQSCVSCHTRTVTFERKDIVAEYTGFPLWLLMGYVDDPEYMPHRQDKSILPYDDKAALAGYSIELKAADGFSISVDSRSIHRNNDIIIAMYKAGEKLPADEAPLVLVWDRKAARLPENLKNIKQIASVEARF
ncbi:MAG TPA: hypothetical protein DCG47_02450 [Spirochaetaceae bacterium]|jgi:hypothetical protein|nr:hypothetical protein [Spirochaetaceae bacterium]